MQLHNDDTVIHKDIWWLKRDWHNGGGCSDRPTENNAFSNIEEHSKVFRRTKGRLRLNALEILVVELEDGILTSNKVPEESKTQNYITRLIAHKLNVPVSLITKTFFNIQFILYLRLYFGLDGGY